MKAADYITMLGMFSGLISIFLSSQGDFALASMFIILAVVFDFLDGRIARYLKQESKFGENLDSLSDLTSFGLAPAMLVLFIFDNLILDIFLLFFVFAGAFRLARFNQQSNKKIFYGMPITVNGLIFPLLVFAGAREMIFLIIIILSSIMMVSKIKIRKI